MVNYLNILDIWDVVQHGYVPQYDPSNVTLTQKVKKLKSQNDYAVKVILNSVSEKNVILFGITKIASEMWETLLNRFEGNYQMKRTKLFLLVYLFYIFGFSFLFCIYMLNLFVSIFSYLNLFIEIFVLDFFSCDYNSSTLFSLKHDIYTSSLNFMIRKNIDQTKCNICIN
jgi:hypothetical protein